MKTTRLTFFLLLLLGSSALIAQQPCSSTNPEMTPTCAEACIICDIDGFRGRHESAIVGTLPNDFCTFTVHNAQWIGFQAASTNLRIQLSVSNCDQGRGLELAIYRSLDCNQFQMISNCFGGINGNSIATGESGIVENTEPLVVGQFYYLAMDGNRADNCDWEFTVLSGSTEVSPLSVTAPIEGAELVCPDVMLSYSTEPEEGAVLFDWTLDGLPVGDVNSPNLDLMLNAPGFYNLCVTGRNACDEATMTCKNIEARTIPITNVSETICDGECFEVDGNTFCDPGTFDYDIALDNGCDSTIRVDLVVLDQPINDLAINLCEGDTIFIGTTPYFTTGQFSNTVQNNLLCDSLVNLDLTIIACLVESQDTPASAICSGESSGSILFSVSVGDPPFSYNWRHLQSNMSGSGNLSALDEQVTIGNLPPGEILIEINDDFGFSDIILAQIDNPEPISIEAEFSEFNDFNISCPDLSDGQINLQPTGGQAPYSYSWSTGEIEPSLNDLAAGTYTVSLTDNLGCEEVQNFELLEPSLVEANMLFSNPNCNGLETGTVEIISTDGGVGPYSYSVNGSQFSEQLVFGQLAPGLIEVAVRDANGCSVMESQELVAPEIPEIVGETAYEVALGCDTELFATINDINVQSIRWADSSYLDCNNCLDPIARPLVTSENQLFVTSEDGCIDSFSIVIAVESFRNFYAPNAFSPNSDGVNDTYAIFGGKEVVNIDLQIYDRYGGIIYESQDLSSGDFDEGWNGTIDGVLVDPGVYVWKATILFLDGFTEVTSGDVTVAN